MHSLQTISEASRDLDKIQGLPTSEPKIRPEGVPLRPSCSPGSSSHK